MPGKWVSVYALYTLILYPAYLSPLASIPNAHWSVPFSRFWILKVRFERRENATLAAVHERLRKGGKGYHGVVRTGPAELSVDGLEGVRVVYSGGGRGGGGWGKGVWYGVFDNYGVPCMFSSKNTAEHSARKRLISHVYSKSFIQSSEVARAQAKEILYHRLLPALINEGGADVQGREPHGVDMYSIFMAAAMDFIAAYVFGIDYGTNLLKDKGYRDHLLEMYKARNDYGIYDQELTWLTGFCRKIGIPFCPGWVDDANRELGEWCKRLCAAKAESSESSGVTGNDNSCVVWNALVSGLEKEAEANGKDSILYPTTLSNMRLSVTSELFDHVLAGQETSGLTLSYLSWRLSQSPQLQAELRTELLGLTPNMQSTNSNAGVARMPDPKQLDSLPLLHAVLMETLRLHSPIPGPQPRESPRQGSQIGPYTVPGGVRVAAMAYTLHRDEDVFPDPEKWDPTRWLSSHAGDEEIKMRNRQFWAFSSGGRMCIGSNFAMQEMKLIVAAIYSNYTTHIVDDEGMAQQSDGYTGRPKKERLYVRLEKVV
ncbi:cytochrome P450 [Immersiella caudata]|uniref:Cytochrome P450 n=1 Tax=Immersiella caudata TaxID=314043 RepID=A0AA40BXC2_9PEZI|nr:cytochrome P450 [Immersiella caudata]